MIRKFNLWWRNAYVLHFLTAFFMLTILNSLLILDNLTIVLISIGLGVGKELIDKLFLKTGFEALKAFITVLGGVLVIFL